MSLRSNVVAFVILAVTITGFIGEAAQNANGQQPGPYFYEETFAAGQVCEFATTVVLEGTFKQIAAGNQLILIGPRVQATVTNLSNPDSAVTLNVPGSFQLSELGGGAVRYEVKGRNLLWGGTLPTLTLTIGTFTFALDASGNEIEPLTGDGQLVDVCQMIE